MHGIRPGNTVLEVRRLGYRPASVDVPVAPGGDTEVIVALAPTAEQLSPVQVRARSEPYDSRLAGFNARKSKHVGYFVTREQLDRMSSARFIDAIREMPGVSVRTLRGGVVTVSLRGQRCSPLFYMDGFPATSGAMDLDMIDLASVEGIEVYSGMTGVPAEFMATSGSQNCGVIAVWSRPFRPKAHNRQSLSREQLEQLIADQTVYTADEVTQPATMRSGEAALPVYPDSLWTAGVSGRVVAEFVVAADGTIEPGSIDVASATHPYFASAVRAALESAVFNPAQLNGKPVRQLVDLPFQFEAGHSRANDPPRLP
jgi:TonB family protein